MAAAVQRAIESGEAFDFEARLITAKKNQRLVRSIGKAIHLDGRLVGMRGMVQDITEQKLAEEALRESEQRFRGAFDTAAHGMALVNPDGQFLSVNRSLCAILGYGAHGEERSGWSQRIKLRRSIPVRSIQTLRKFMISTELKIKISIIL